MVFQLETSRYFGFEGLRLWSSVRALHEHDDNEEKEKKKSVETAETIENERKSDGSIASTE